MTLSGRGKPPERSLPTTTKQGADWVVKLTRALFPIHFREVALTMAAETYIISIYRRDRKSGSQLTGLAEHTGSGERKSFSDSAELWAFLSGSETSQSKKTKRGRKEKERP